MTESNLLRTSNIKNTATEKALQAWAEKKLKPSGVYPRTKLMLWASKGSDDGRSRAMYGFTKPPLPTFETSMHKAMVPIMRSMRPHLSLFFTTK